MKMSLRWGICLALVIGVSLSGVSCVKKPGASPGERVVNLAVWSHFISDQALEEFRSQSGIRVQVTHYSSNEELLAKLQAGATGFEDRKSVV